MTSANTLKSNDTVASPLDGNKIFLSFLSREIEVQLSASSKNKNLIRKLVGFII